MGVIHLPARHRSHRWLIACLVGVVLISAWLGRALLYESWTLASLPAFWWSGSDRFLLSAPGSDFDISFANYSITQTSAAPFEDRVPPILHHVAMGGAGAAARIEQWKEVRQSCLDIHPGWEAHIWTDEKANAFVAEQFPELREMWKGYQFPIQRIDALRYMVLYHYGGEFCLPPPGPFPGRQSATTANRLPRCDPRHGPAVPPRPRPAPTVRLCGARRPSHRLLGRLYDGEPAQPVRRRARAQPAPL